jgi:hypothetical protein
VKRTLESSPPVPPPGAAPVIAPQPAPGPVRAGFQGLAVPVPAPTAPVPVPAAARAGAAGLPHVSSSLGGASFGELSVSPLGEDELGHSQQVPFEPEIGRVGSFEQRRRFSVPTRPDGTPEPGVVVQHVRRRFADVRRGPPGSASRPLSDAEIDRVAASRGGQAHAGEHEYLEAWRTDDPDLVDTFGATAIAPGGRLRRTTSGGFAISGDARLYRTGDPRGLLDSLGFSQPGARRDTPAGGLAERPLGASTNPPLASLEDLERAASLQPAGQVTHRVEASWDSFAPRRPGDDDLFTELAFNGRPYQEPAAAPPPPPPSPVPARPRRHRRSSSDPPPVKRSRRRSRAGPSDDDHS